jgi:hypothetical protein
MDAVLRGTKREKSYKLNWNIRKNRIDGKEERGGPPPSSNDLSHAL